MDSVLVTAYMRPVQDQTRQKSQSGKGSDHTFLLLAEEMLVIYGFWESKSQFSSSFFLLWPISYPWSGRWSYTHAHKISTKWTQWFKKKKNTWNREGKGVRRIEKRCVRFWNNKTKKKSQQILSCFLQTISSHFMHYYLWQIICHAWFCFP